MNTRKKVNKIVYKDENDSEEETGDFSDSGSEAKISEESSSEDEEEVHHNASSGDEFVKSKTNTTKKQAPRRKPKFAKSFVNKITKQSSGENENEDVTPALFSVKDLTDADKLLPSVLNLSESDSSDDECSKPATKNITVLPTYSQSHDDSDAEAQPDYKDVWSDNIQNSEEIARKAFLELEQHKSEIEQTKATLHNYTTKQQTDENLDVSDLLAQGEEEITSPKKVPVKKKIKGKKVKDDSDSEMEDWEEVQESKAIPQQGLQLFVELPGSVCRKTKKIDVEMMMKRKINRVKKEYQVYMHKVHILCWLGHGNYVSRILNDQELLAASLSLVPGKECYPGERVDLKYVEQITTWYKDKLTLKLDKHENKFRPKAPPLKEILLGQIKSRAVTSRKYLVFIFVAMLRAIGLQCRIMFNFVTLPIKPPSSELCSLSTKPSETKEPSQKPKDVSKDDNKKNTTNKASSKSKNVKKIAQVDGNYDSTDDDFEHIMQVDGNSDVQAAPSRSTRARKAKNTTTNDDDNVSPPKRSKKSPSPKPKSKSTNKTEIKREQGDSVKSEVDTETDKKAPQKISDSKMKKNIKDKLENSIGKQESDAGLTINDESKAKKEAPSKRKTRSANNNSKDSSNTDKSCKTDEETKKSSNRRKLEPPKLVVTDVCGNEKSHSSKYFKPENTPEEKSKTNAARKRAKTANPSDVKDIKGDIQKTRTKSEPGSSFATSKYFESNSESHRNLNKKSRLSLKSNKSEDEQRVSHRDLAKKKTKTNNDVTGDLVNIIKGRVKEAKANSKMGIVKGKIKKESDDEDSDFLPEEESKHKAESDDDFKPCKISPKPSVSKKRIDRRVLSSDDDTPSNKVDVWCEVYVEELEQWISVNVIRARVHCPENLYTGATHPVCYVVGWDNNNYLKDLTRRYVPHWNTVTRKQRVEPAWWSTAVQPYIGPRNARDKEENEQLDRMQMEAPLPKSIAEYKNHPLYALKRHLLKFEAIYPPDAATLGFVRGEAVYARDCVHTCRSRDTWLKEAKVVRMGEEPYKVVKARPKWDKLSNKLITDKPLEVFGPWQVQDYEPPTAEGGIVPRNAYGNVELFKACMLPKGTVHIKLPGLNRVAKKLNIDCAPAMTGFEFNGGWSHPVYDGFVVCEEFGDIITEAWVADQEELERKEQEKTETRVYGNWRRLIKGLLIRERLKNKYGFEEPTTSQEKKKAKGPRLVVSKRHN